ncbi:hypothetical protein DICA3_C14950 [Diutina catenulata]
MARFETASCLAAPSGSATEVAWLEKELYNHDRATKTMLAVFRRGHRTNWRWKRSYQRMVGNARRNRSRILMALHAQRYLLAQADEKQSHDDDVEMTESISDSDDLGHEALASDEDESETDSQVEPSGEQAPGCRVRNPEEVIANEKAGTILSLYEYHKAFGRSIEPEGLEHALTELQRDYLHYYRVKKSLLLGSLQRIKQLDTRANVLKRAESFSRSMEFKIVDFYYHKSVMKALKELYADCHREVAKSEATVGKEE